ncbi:MAG: VCBS repeat-containing protein [Anderseniella sp.]
MKHLLWFCFFMLLVNPAIAAEPARLPDGLIVKGSNDIAEAWLVRPTGRYAHGILGDDIEAGGMMVKTSDGQLIEYVLPDEFVFEDRQVRVRDLDGDGRDEIVVVLSSRTEGGALAIYGLEGNRIVKRAQTPHIGRANRWLNPAEIADLDGDGKLDIVFVTTPHLGKVVEVWTYSSGKLKQVTTLAGYSNHIIGSRVQDMTEVVILKDGRTALAIPGAGYDEIAFLVLKDGRLAAVSKMPVGSRIVSRVVTSKNGRQLEFTTTKSGPAILPIP